MYIFIKSLIEYLNESIEKINVPSEIEKNGTTYELAISHDYDALGRKKHGYLAQHINYETKETLIGFAGETKKELEDKINKYLKDENLN